MSSCVVFQVPPRRGSGSCLPRLERVMLRKVVARKGAPNGVQHATLRESPRQRVLRLAPGTDRAGLLHQPEEENDCH